MVHARLGLGHDQPFQGQYFQINIPGTNEGPYHFREMSSLFSMQLIVVWRQNQLVVVGRVWCQRCSALLPYNACVRLSRIADRLVLTGCIWRQHQSALLL